MDNPIEELFFSYTGVRPADCVRLSPSGSRRSYFRLSGPEGSVIGVQGTDKDENHAFITIASHLKGKGIAVPEVLAVSADGMCYLQNDLGDTLLYDVLAGSRSRGEYGEEDSKLLCRVMSMLPKIQFRGAEGLDFNVCYPTSSLNARMVDFDLNYFKYCFLKPSSVEFNEERLQDDFDALKHDIMAEPMDVFMYRDFQARNVMMKDGEPWFIDFQGGRRGPVYYDVASFVWQAKAAYPEPLKRRMVDAYIDALSEYRPVDRDEFMSKLRIFVLFRTLQVLGAYGFRGRIEKRAHFLESIPYALANLRELLREPFVQYPYLSEVLSKLSEEGPAPARAADDGRLEVHIYSFSFKKGIPEDFSGNGGGYVFDCRSVHNPGKYERFRRSTGLDADVQEFLETDGEIFPFLESAFSLVDAHVSRFVERGFSHMQVSFGCTGGQHRSAYSAQKLAEHLAGRPGVKVHLTHRELKIDKYL
ncbi:MAG: RNase adapter RapZ [Bacteroidia bacterium]|nr:RNase adapter RapZ [Bacteroidia bacterium]